MIVRFFQRYALVFALLAGMAARELILPEDAPWWLSLTVGIPVVTGVVLLLHKDGVTNRRKERGKGTLSR